MSWNSQCRPGWSLTYQDLPSSASPMLELKACTRLSCHFFMAAFVKNCQCCHVHSLSLSLSLSLNICISPCVWRCRKGLDCFVELISHVVLKETRPCSRHLGKGMFTWYQKTAECPQCFSKGTTHISLLPLLHI